MGEIANEAMKRGLGVRSLGLGMALAASHSGGPFLAHPDENDLRASDSMGATVFVTEADVAATTVDAVPEEWESVASIDDFLLAQDGTIRGVLVDVGGFLGIGARTVAVDSDQIEIQVDPERDDSRVYLNMTREELEALPEYDQ